MDTLFARVDERLIHLQITRKWLSSRPFQRLVIADDEICEDFLTAGILKLSAPDGMETEILTTAQAEVSLKESGKDTFLLVKRLETVLALLTAGVDISLVNIGQIPAGKGRRPFASIYLSKEEKAILSEILDRGVTAVIQMVPDEEPCVLTAEMLKEGAQ